MSLVLRRSYMRAKTSVFSSSNNIQIINTKVCRVPRSFSDDNAQKCADYISSTILIENGLNVQELPVLIKKMKYLSEETEGLVSVNEKSTTDSQNYHLIQAEFKECLTLRDVFTLLSKCVKITPNIALGAMERIYDLEKNPHSLDIISNNITVAKDAIVDKLIKVVMKTEETQTILNALNSVSSFIDPYKYQFCDEIVLRSVDNKLTVEQLCNFISFLVNNKSDSKYAKIIDKLWAGLVARENDINENNLLSIFILLPHFQESKRTVLYLLEQKLAELWNKIKTADILEIFNIYLNEKSSSSQTNSVFSCWLNTNIHLLDEDNLLEILTKFIKLKYSDERIEKSIEKYVKLKGCKIQSPILIVGILNYCMQFKIKSDIILNGCCEYFLSKGNLIPHSFYKSVTDPYGFLIFNPAKGDEFWKKIEDNVLHNFDKMKIDDVCSIMLSLLYNEIHSIKLANKIFNAEQLSKIKNDDIMCNLHLIDTAMSLECKEYLGPLLPKDHWTKSITQDARIKNIISKISDTLVSVAGNTENLSTCALIPHLYSHETYLIDVMIHPVGLGSSTFNWKMKSGRNQNIALLIHLPEHYISDNVHLIGPQEMRKRHLRLLGMKVVSLQYSKLCKYQAKNSKVELEKYLLNSIESAET